MTVFDVIQYHTQERCSDYCDQFRFCKVAINLIKSGEIIGKER